MGPLSTMMKILVECCFFLAILSSSQANITALCDSADMYWELREDKQVNMFTCTGLAAQDTVRWVLQDPTFRYIILGSCPPRLMGGEVVCESQFSYAPPSRISDNTSVITINTSGISTSILDGKGRLICSVPNVPGAEGSCRMDYIYPGENISCSVQVNNTQTVFGQCTVGKIRSSQNRYRCEWIQTRESSSEDILIANTSMTVVPSLRSYFSGRCNFTSHLPSDGLYTYRVTIVPGEVTVNATFIGSSEIFKTTVTTSAESSSAATTKTTTLKAEATTKAAVTTTAETREEEITTFETTKLTTENAGSTTEGATEAATTTKEAASAIQMSKAASTTTAVSDYATRDISGTTVTNTVLLGQRCQERCSACKRVKVQLELVSGPVSYPSDTQSFSFSNSGY
ncbi:uncharacterized protein LOC112568235 [Pomacea canaliculata]|uniref:uncharacterized protein LOC112568235 n=1 Tax=Pomacea canaliculata TaxID=400727 RepID=UPI000D725D16|nr:uncharacterized protein LOC112568235 [Pomacea canaliculata]XP_025101220.1 uncharacterized protein LOC112568235 [Pomacea canaliculata]